jgi:RimJ/RimL family protein N-acetyltransferase
MKNDVVLRAWQKQDAQQLAAIANNRRIWNNVRDRLPSPYTVVDALQWIAHVNLQEPMVHFAIIYQGRVAGSIGCMLKEDISRRSVEIGYLVGELFWGKGIATEAVRLLLLFIEQKLDMVRVFAHVFEHNTASMNVLRKNGFYLESIQRKAVVKNNQVMDDYVWVKLLA